MLWKKESRQPGALYTDLFVPNIQHLDATLNSLLQNIDQMPHPEKSDSIALEKRNKGNQKFRDSAPLEAMELYSDSLRFAVPGSEHISLAYANRSACFLQMKLYDECLIDIEYAMAAGYPEHLRPKLDDRKDRCLKEMQEDPHYPREKLSIEPDEKIPNLSNMVKIQRNGDAMDYSVVAKADIDVGQPIVVEDPFYAHLRDRFGVHCNICQSEFRNLVPCEGCSAAMFCPQCQGHFLHEYECGFNFCEGSEWNGYIMHLVRGILLVLQLFPSVDELIVFVEQMLQNPNELPTSLLDDRSKYQAYFKAPIKVNIDPIEGLVELIYPVYKTLLRIPHVNEMFKTTKYQRFLMHLIGHHVTIPYYTSGIGVDYGAKGQSRPPVLISHIMRSYIKHSCCPNVVNFSCDGKSVLFSIKPIKKGEQVFATFASSRLHSSEERKQYLLDKFNLNCECSRCQGKAASPAQRRQFTYDPAYCYIHANVRSLHPLEFNTNQFESMMGACVAVLQKFGHMDWCNEMEFVLQLFQSLYRIRLIGGGSGFNHPFARQFLPR